MDLLDFSDCELYFDEPLPKPVDRLLQDASHQYGDGGAELSLLRAYLQAPEHLSVLVGLYRFYFYQHRLDDSLCVAARAMTIASRRLDIPARWQELGEQHLAQGAAKSFGLLRFYLLALKASAVVLLRLGRIDESRSILQKLMILDQRDQLGAGRLLEVVDEFHRQPASKDSERKPALHAMEAPPRIIPQVFYT